MTTGTIFNVQRYAIHDGPGIRVTIFLKGCPLRCLWCHNPEGQDPSPEPMSDGPCIRTARPSDEVATCGRVVAVDDVIREIDKDVLFFDESGGGATFSGGEPLMQPDFLRALLHACRQRGIHTVVDTCGHAPDDVFRSIVDAADLFLFDLKLMDDALHREYTGASNGLILQNLQTLDARRHPTVIRIPLIPGITDTEKNMSETIDFLAALSSIHDVALLPYHRTGSGKYERIRRRYELRDGDPHSAEQIDTIKRLLEGNGARVTVGG